MTSMQKAFISAVAVATIGTGSMGISTALAAEPTARPGVENLIQAIATKFNLSQDEVQKVFDEQRAIGAAAREANQDQHQADRLAKAVTDGKLTQAQADLIVAKRAELEASKPDLTGKTPAEIKLVIDTQRIALEKWAKDNGIPPTFILRHAPFSGRHGGRMHGHK